MPRRNQGPRLRWLSKRKCYYVIWTERGRSRECSTGTIDREQAEIFFADWLYARGRKSGPSDPSALLVTDILNDYATERGPKVAAADRIAYAVLALTDFFEGNTVADVTPQTCTRYATKRGRAPGTVRRELGVLRAAINHAFKNGRLTRVVPVELPERPESRDRWLNRDEAAALIRAARTPQARAYMPLFILIGLYTGRRKEAILSLRWPQVDLDAGQIDFEVPGRRRTNKKRGMVKIPPRLLPHLRRARMRGTELGYVVHEHGERIGDIKKGFAGACARADKARAERAAAAGLPAPPPLSGTVTPHTLRHTCATWLMQAGVDRWEASGFLSMSTETLERVYGHHHPDHMREAAEAIGRRPRNVRGIG
ncbi:MAG: tyrosine-type recombinase/integrase [Alphaproteobacteria bacterium]